MENELTNLLDNIKNKEEKTIIDFGCGHGASTPYIRKFKEIFAVDFSENMLCQAKKKFNQKNITYIKADLKSAFICAADIVIAISSVMPKNKADFDEVIRNFIRNLKINGKIILVVPSLESKTFAIQLLAKYYAEKNINPLIVEELIKREEQKRKFSALGFINTSINLTQKHWLKEEILLALTKYEFSKIQTCKLMLDWEKQIKAKKTEFHKYPQQWFWLVEIDL